MDDLWWYRRLAGALAAGAHRRPPGRGARSVAFVSPARFADDSIVGGGERTAWDLAAAMARLVPTRMVSFGPERLSTTRGPLRIEIHPPRRYIRNADFDPLSFGFLRDLAGVDVVHCNHYRLDPLLLALFGELGAPMEQFLTWLREPAPEGAEAGATRYLYELHRARPDLQAAFPAVGPELVGWARMAGAQEPALLGDLLYASAERAGAGSLE